MKIGAAYHFSLDKKQTNIITFGAQFINGSRDYNRLNQKDGRVKLQTGFNDFDIEHFNLGPAQELVPETTIVIMLNSTLIRI